MLPSRLRGENPKPQIETSEETKKEVLGEIEGLNLLKVKLADAFTWLHSDFKQKKYKILVDSQKALDDDGTSMDKFNALKLAREDVNNALSASKEIQNLAEVDISDLKHFNDYCVSHEIEKTFRLSPLRSGQTTFSLPLYLGKISEAQIAIDNYINNTVFFLKSTQKNLDITPKPTNPQEETDEPYLSE